MRSDRRIEVVMTLEEMDAVLMMSGPSKGLPPMSIERKAVQKVESARAVLKARQDGMLVTRPTVGECRNMMQKVSGGGVQR